MTRLLLDFLNNFPKRLYSNYTFFFFKTNSVFNFSLGLPRNICEFKLKAAKLLNPYKCRNFLKFGLSCLSFLIAALRVTKGFIRFWATSQPQLLATWLRIKNRVLEHFFRVVLFHDTRSSDLRFMHNCLSLHIMKELMQEETV